MVDQQSVAAQLLKDAPAAAAAGPKRRDARGRLFKMPGGADPTAAVGPGLVADSDDGRYAATKRDLYRLQAQQDWEQRQAMAAALERAATESGSLTATGVDASNKMMAALFDVTNRPHRVQAEHEAAAAARAAAAAARVDGGPRGFGGGGGLKSAFVFEATKDRHVFDLQAEGDGLMDDLRRLQNQTPLRLPAPPAPDPRTGATRSLGTILDATRGHRLGPSPVNQAIFFRNFARKDGRAYSAGMSWLEDYRGLQAELDAMEFSTARSLGYLQENKHRFYAMPAPYADPVAAAKAAAARAPAPSSGQVRSSGPGSGGVAAAAPSLLSRAPSAAVPLLADVSQRQFRGGGVLG